MSGGVSGGSQKGNQRQDNKYTGTTMPIIGEDWLKGYGGLGDTLGQTGVTGAQQSNIGDIGSVRNAQNYYTQSGYYGLGDMAQRFPGSSWDAPQDVTAQNVNAQSGADFMGAYKNPFDQDVINSSVNDYNTNVDRNLSGLRASRDASGAFGDRAAIADSAYLGDATRGLGSMVSGLRQQGFNTAAGLGQSDANRFLQASGMNASNKMAADTFNNNLTNNRQQFDVNTGFQGDSNRMQALRDMNNSTLLQSGIQSGGVDNLMNYLNLGTNTFGQQADGNSSGTSSTSSKSKGGGISGGMTP